jgi:hypothetical protein
MSKSKFINKIMIYWENFVQYKFINQILYINSLSPSVCDGARLRHGQTTGPGPEKPGFGTGFGNGILKTGFGKTGPDRDSRDSENGISENGKRDSEKRESAFKPIGPGPAKTGSSLSVLCSCNSRSHQQEKVGNSLKEDLAKPDYKSYI